MKRLRLFAAFWYDFVVGDDWRVAVGVIAGSSATAAVVHLGHLAAWWLLPVVVVVVLVVSVQAATRASRRSG